MLTTDDRHAAQPYEATRREPYSPAWSPPYNPYADHRTRLWAAALLRAASRVLDGVAARLVLTPRAPGAYSVIEFHCDAGAPEGALYVGGQLVGHVMGVTRL